MKTRICMALLLLWQLEASAGTYNLDVEDRAAVVERVIEHLENDYVDAEIGSTAAQRLKADVARGDFDEFTNGDRFATALSDRLQSLSGDGHLNVEYSEKAIDLSTAAEDDFSAEQMERYYGAHLNYGVQRVERLEGNIGLLDLRVFAPLDMGGETVIAAMNVIANTDALIIDLRENGGGIGDMAGLVASYLFDGGRQALTGVYDRPSDTLTQRFTQAYVPGRRFGGAKPVYVLISPKTFSAAEALAYSLQALDRAVIVGETSGGGAHPFSYLPIHAHFVLWSVTAKSVNPITGGNWQSVGVQPDIEVSSVEALSVAIAEINAR